jgi:septum formation protein
VYFTVRPARTPELERGDPGDVARANALRKASDAWEQGRAAGERARAVLGCDTLVALAGVIYGKPADAAAARRTLAALSDATHEVVSGVAVLQPPGSEDPDRADLPAAAARERVAIARTAVTFRALDDGLLDWYLARGEWRGRAGGYAIQGAGAALVRKVEGDYENVVGLPLATLLDIFPELLAS